MRPLLTTARLQLRAFSHVDAPELHELFSDPLTNTIGAGPFTSIVQTEQWIDNRLAAQREHSLCWYALRSRDTDELIGNCGMLKGRAGYAEPEIGYLIANSHQRRGLATEAADAVIQECRASNLARVWASIRPHNSASHRIAERLGMRLHRTEADDRGELHFYVIDLESTASSR